MLPKSFGKYWFWVAFPSGFVAGVAISWWIGVLTFWFLLIAPHLLYALYRRMARRSQPPPGGSLW